MSADISEELSSQTRDLVSKFEGRAESFRDRPDLFPVTVPLDSSAARKAAVDRFGPGEHVATGIDGSMDFDERLQMMLFYSNATAYSCDFRVGERLTFDLDSARRDSRTAASAAIPLWAEDLGSVFSSEPEVDLDLEHSMERIPNSFMTLGELYLAARACETAKVIFLDRPLSGTFSTLSRDARLLLKRGETKLAKWSGKVRVSLLDVYLGVQLGAPGTPLPVRARYLPARVLRELLAGSRTVDQLAISLGVHPSNIRTALTRIRRKEKETGWEILSEAGETAGLREGVSGYWERLSAFSLDYAESVFARRSHPLALSSDEYLTILDVNAVSLFLLCVLCQRAAGRGALVMGIAKDTTATDIARSVLPFAVAEGLVRPASELPRLKNDRAFLAILSSENPAIATPWRTVGYDSAFSTMIRTDSGFASARKVVSREQLFVRSFFQLRTARTDPSVRSPVFLFDRPFEEKADGGQTRPVEVMERSGPAVVDAYFEEGGPSDLSNLALAVLSVSDNPEVFEAFGHNQLLFLADKAVKAEVRMLRSSLRGVADLRVGGVSRRRKVFGLVTTYREQRSEAEHARVRGA